MKARKKNGGDKASSRSLSFRGNREYRRAMKFAAMTSCLVSVALLVAACTNDDPPVIARRCTTDAECRDGIYCNGVETCVSVGGGRSYCQFGTPPCTGGQVCQEDGARCAEPGCVDADGDGHIKAGCAGGDDCDDSDPARYPGATELCDGVDQDCNPATLGPDGDGDGEVSTACCNPNPPAAPLCGTDCDDARKSVYSSAIEVCNGMDDDCDGVIDNGATVASYADADGDGYGAGPAVQKCAGTTGYSTLGNDCDDGNPSITPGVMRCNLATPQNLNDIETCTSTGTYKGGICSGIEQCRVQPNGTGICL